MKTIMKTIMKTNVQAKAFSERAKAPLATPTDLDATATRDIAASGNSWS